LNVELLSTVQLQKVFSDSEAGLLRQRHSLKLPTAQLPSAAVHHHFSANLLASTLDSSTLHDASALKCSSGYDLLSGSSGGAFQQRVRFCNEYL